MMSENTSLTLASLSEGPESTLLSWNGTCPESPDGERLAYFKMPCPVDENVRDFTGEIWACNHDLTDHRKVFEMGMCCKGFQHNGGMQMWIDDNRLAFRATGGAGPFEAIYVVDADTGALLHKPIVGGLGHYAVNHKVPFSVSPDQQSSNAAYPAIDEPGIYALDCDSGQVEKIVTSEAVLDFVRLQGYTPNDSSSNIAHVMFNFEESRVMSRWTFEECGALVSCNSDGGDFELFPNRPLHQIWFDNETYFAFNREAESICRFNQDGTEIETLAGPGNHIDASPNRQWFVTDSMYHQTPITIRLYRRGDIEPAAELDRHNFHRTTWNPFRGHSNPVFSRDGKYVYFNRAFEETQVHVVRVNIESIIFEKK